VPDHRTPIEERWGGGMSTGKVGKARHRGNAMVTDMEHPEAMILAGNLERRIALKTSSTPTRTFRRTATSSRCWFLNTRCA
jgi:hypothetical protein